MTTSNETTIVRKCRHACTLCALMGNIENDVTVHHIDGNDENDNLDNLTVLCYPHHIKAQNDLQIKKSMTRKLTKKDLIFYRNRWIKRCEGSEHQKFVKEPSKIKGRKEDWKILAEKLMKF